MTATIAGRMTAPHPRRGALLGIVAAAVAAAAVAGYLLFRGPVTVAVAFCVLPSLVWLVANPRPALVLLGASIPVTYSLNRGHGGLNVSPSDLMLVAVAAGLLLTATLTDSLPAMRALRPLKRPVMQYMLFLGALLAIHLSLSAHLDVTDAAQTAQRLEIFALPLVIGAFAALTNRHMVVLKAYVLSASALAVLWPVYPGILGQKNPVGQMLAGALLLLVGVRGLRSYIPLMAVLAPGLILTGSRGAVVAVGIGLVVILALQESRFRALFTRVAVIALLAVGTYSLLPVSLQTRLTTFTAGTNSRAAYALHIRQQYAADAYRIIKAHPIIGIGVGNYLAGDPRDLTQTSDPHDVLLLQAAEGGYVFALSFLVLLGGTALALLRVRTAELAPVAAAVLLATFMHGLVDIYWVRGTPVLGWMLAGMVFGSLGVARVSNDHRVSA